MKIKANCPDCAYAVDAATGVDDPENDTPGVGDIAICLRCAGVSFYYMRVDGALGLRPPNEAEREDMETHPEVVSYRALILKMAAAE